MVRERINALGSLGNLNYLQQRSREPKDKTFFLIKVDICNVVLRMLKGCEKRLNKEDVSDIDNSEIIDMAIFLGEREEKIEKKESKNYKPDIVLIEFMSAIQQNVQVVLTTSSLLRSIFDFYDRYEAEKNEIKKSASLHHQILLERFVKNQGIRLVFLFLASKDRSKYECREGHKCLCVHFPILFKVCIFRFVRESWGSLRSVNS